MEPTGPPGVRAAMTVVERRGKAPELLRVSLLAALAMTAFAANSVLLLIVRRSAAVDRRAWAGYTLRGRGSGHPDLVTAGNFLGSVPLAVALWAPVLLLCGHRCRCSARTHCTSTLHVNAEGAFLAVISGAVSCGLGYALWYTVLPWLTRVQSGIVQMAPAPLAAIGGLAVLGEPITAKVLLSSLLILGGVLIGVLRPPRKVRDRPSFTAGP